MSKTTVLIEARPFCAFDDAAFKKLESANLNLIDLRGSGVEDPEFIEALKICEIVLSGNDLTLDERTLDLAPKLKAVSKFGVGLDVIDIEAASKRGVVVFNTPGANREAVADHAFALILSLARKIVYCDQSIRQKRWEHAKIMGMEIWGKTMGIIGLGAIGRSVALRAQGFRMKIIAHDPFWPNDFAKEHQIERVDMEDLLERSDIVTIHSPLTPENAGMINKRTLAKMKPEALLINTARGEIINEEDLCQALKERVIAGAGIDAFENEPPLNSKLLELDNAILTPHTAAFTYESMNNMGIQAAEQIIEYLNGGQPKNTVNKEVFANADRRTT